MISLSIPSSLINDPPFQEVAFVLRLADQSAIQQKEKELIWMILNFPPRSSHKDKQNVRWGNGKHWLLAQSKS